MILQPLHNHPHNLISFPNNKIPSHSHPYLKRPNYRCSSAPFPSHSLSKVSGSTLCHCHHDPSSSSDNSIHWRWDSVLTEVVKSAIKCFNSNPNHLDTDTGIVEEPQIKDED
ncbi:Protein EXECUTER 1, chloroplastic [Fagus crenata]